MKLYTLWLLLLSSPACAADAWTYWIEPCTETAAVESHCKARDPELAKWALEAWQQSSGGALRVQPVGQEQAARLRVHWVSGRSQLYGEARPIEFAGQRGAEVYVLPSMAKAGEDPLLRETVVYLTCLHETGHALGLAHTAAFADIMYTFQFGGDIAEYFGRFRRKLEARGDITRTSAISVADHAALMLALSVR
jgi:hypothetical protein